MSRYAVDKVLHEVGRDPTVRREFLSDPEQYLAGRDLDEAELQALTAHDYRTLYAMGAHPFLVWGFTAAVCAGPNKPMPKVMQEYLAAIGPLGRPDYST